MAGKAVAPEGSLCFQGMAEQAFAPWGVCVSSGHGWAGFCTMGCFCVLLTRGASVFSWCEWAGSHTMGGSLYPQGTAGEALTQGGIFVFSCRVVAGQALAPWGYLHPHGVAGQAFTPWGIFVSSGHE